jgi:competence protein ComEC
MGGSLFAALLGWVLGTALQLCQPALWSAFTYVGLLGLSLSLGLAASWLRYRRPAACARAGGQSLLLLLLLLAALGAGYAQVGWRAVLYQRSAFPAALEGQDLWLVGVVDSLPQTRDGPVPSLRFTLRVESHGRIESSAQPPPAWSDARSRRVQLTWSQSDATERSAHLQQPGQVERPNGQIESRMPLRVGERWRLPVRLRAPHGHRNPHGDDRELWLWERGIQALGQVRVQPGLPQPQRLEQTAELPIEQLRQRARERIYAELSDQQQQLRLSGMLAALVLGDQSGIERSDWTVLRDTGVAHLVAVSGLHITMFCWLAVWLIRLLWPRWPRLLALAPTPVAALTGGLALATLYALFCGWGIPAQRTILVLSMVSALRLGGAQWPLPMVWLTAMAAVVALDPWALLQAGFWLSFVAVGVLFAAGPQRSSLVHLEAGPALEWGVSRWRGAPKWVMGQGWSMLHEQWLMMLSLMPLSLVLFHQMSLVGLLLNVLAIPLVTLLILPLALLGLLWPDLWRVDAMILASLLDGLAWCAAWPGATWVAAARPPLLALLALAAGLLAALRVPWQWKLMGVPWLLPFFFWSWPAPPTGEFVVTALDVGQGQAVLIQTAQHALLYDAGPLYGRPGQAVLDAGVQVVVPYLQARAIRLDRLLLSHSDSDHTGGATAVLQQQQVDWMGSVPPEHALHGLRPGQPCQAGQRWEWDGVVFQVLYPPLVDLPAQRRSPNSQSCVLWVGNRHSAVLLPGDIGQPEERQLLALWPAQLPLKINGLLMPHHGSRHSSSAALLVALQPDWVLAQTGYRNRFGHPHADVVARYRQLDSQVLDSPRCGAWRWSSQQPQQGRCERQVAARYWQHQP